MKTPLSRPVVSLVLLVTSWIPAVRSGPVKVTRATEAVNYNAIAEHYVPVRKVEGNSPSVDRARVANSLHQVGTDAEVDLTPPFSKARIRSTRDVYFVVDVEVGGQSLPLRVDTDSSDTWLITDSFLCVNRNYQPVATKQCGFARGYAGALGQRVEPDLDFQVQYGNDLFVAGYYGYDDITVGGLTARHQQLAMVNYTFWFSADSTSSGTLGLAYPFMTGLDNPKQQYDPLFTTLWKQNLTRPMFSLALSRDAGDPNKQAESYLAFGGVPPTIEYDETSWGRAPIRPLRTLAPWGVLESDDTGLYVITPDAWVYGKEGKDLVVNKTAAASVNLEINTSAMLSDLPHDLAQEIYKMFDPPAAWYGPRGGIFAPCNATTPRVGMRIGEQTYYFSPSDLLHQNDRDKDGTRCRVGIQDPYAGPYTLGINFLSNVVAVFDVGNQEMRFANRKSY